MCLTCGCMRPSDDHNDPRNLVLGQLEEAARAAQITAQAAADNLCATVDHTVRKGARMPRITVDVPAEGLLIMPVAKSTPDVPSDGVGCAVVKAVDELRYTLGIAYPANRPDVGKAADGYRDFAGADVLRDAAWNYMRKGARIGLHHADGTDGAGTVVESYIWPDGAPDWPHPNGYVVKAGDWCLGVVWEEPAWEMVKSGRVRGFSPQGAAHRRRPAPEVVASLRAATKHL